MTDADIIISKKIYIIRGQKVMLDFDLAELYVTETRRLNESVKRNKSRFPDDFMFQLTGEEKELLMSQFATSIKGGRTKDFYAFTELGIAMLSSILNTEVAIQVNIQIMRTFQKLRELLVSNQELKRKLEDLERTYEGRFKVIFKALKHMLDEPLKPKEKLGFRT
jgi:hypothetical protein